VCNNHDDGTGDRGGGGDGSGDDDHILTDELAILKAEVAQTKKSYNMVKHPQLQYGGKTAFYWLANA